MLAVGYRVSLIVAAGRAGKRPPASAYSGNGSLYQNCPIGRPSGAHPWRNSGQACRRNHCHWDMRYGGASPPFRSAVRPKFPPRLRDPHPRDHASFRRHDFANAAIAARAKGEPSAHRGRVLGSFPIRQSLKRCTLSWPSWLRPSVASGSSLPTIARHICALVAMSSGAVEGFVLCAA
jgi:hypothetical protein